MDVLGVRPMKTQKQLKRVRREKPLKVVYISSPMKVKASASEFRALVQELTGRDSDVERAFMEINADGDRSSSGDDDPRVTVSDDRDHQKRRLEEEIDGRDESCAGFGIGFSMINSAGFFDFPVEFDKYFVE